MLSLCIVWEKGTELQGGKKWETLDQNGPMFAPPYERVPKNVKFYYDGKSMELSDLTEEGAGFYAKEIDGKYVKKKLFNKNFFESWRKDMTPKEKEIIKDFSKCNFNEFKEYYKRTLKERKNMSKEERAKIKKKNDELRKKYGFCTIDGHEEVIDNFKIEPPGIFKGRGEHPKMGTLKGRIEAEDVILNIGEKAQVPEPPPGHKWGGVQHDQTVTWLARWKDEVTGVFKYIRLHPSSKLKQQADKKKYETARQLNGVIPKIRENYTEDLKRYGKSEKSEKDMKVLQRAVSLNLLDKVALRAGTKKGMDTVGLCSIRVEHIKLEKNGQNFEVRFDFLGKGSIRYENTVVVEKAVYKCLKLFKDNKQLGDQLFDLLNAVELNKYLNNWMKGLTAKVFRTYNACKLMEEKLDELTKKEMTMKEKIFTYNRANREVAILCNHRRDVPKNFSKSMENLEKKIKEKEKEIKEAEEFSKKGGSKEKLAYNDKKLTELEEQLKKLQIQATFMEDTKTINVNSSRSDYLDPRITVAWCKKWNVPIEKIFAPWEIRKFKWAIMVGADYQFCTLKSALA